MSKSLAENAVQQPLTYLAHYVFFFFFYVLSLNSLCHWQALPNVENRRPVTFLATSGASVSQAAEK